jgi:hypothetical protein
MNVNSLTLETGVIDRIGVSWRHHGANSFSGLRGFLEIFENFELRISENEVEVF